MSNETARPGAGQKPGTAPAANGPKRPARKKKPAAKKPAAAKKQAPAQPAPPESRPLKELPPALPAPRAQQPEALAVQASPAAGQAPAPQPPERSSPDEPEARPPKAQEASPQRQPPAQEGAAPPAPVAPPPAGEETPRAPQAQTPPVMGLEFSALSGPAHPAPKAPQPLPQTAQTAPRPTQSASVQQPLARKKKKNSSSTARALVTLLLLALAAVGGWLLRGGVQPQPPASVPASVPAQSLPPEEPQAPPAPDLTATEANGAIGILRLANTQNPLPEGYVPPELTTMDSEGRQLDARAAGPLNEMIAAAKADGITLVLCSGYRSEERQKMLFVSMIQDYLARGYSQADAYTATKHLRNLPGTSEHQTGLAADIVTPDYWDLDEGFADTAGAKWLVEHAADYGFILRYPKDKTEITGTSFEPWHYRYVGPEDAKKIMEQKICLEEYLGQAG